MNPTITIDNYEEIMFRLIEDDFDEPTRNLLLEQIEGNVLFKFEWEQWQKTRCIDPIDNYAAESLALTEKIILIAKPQVFTRRRKVLYLAAASIAALITSFVLLTTNFNSGHKQVVELPSETPALELDKPQTTENTHSDYITNDAEPKQEPKKPEKDKLIAEVSGTTEVKSKDTDKIPVMLDSIPESIINLASVHQEKSRYIITIETSPIDESNQQPNEIAQNEKPNLKKVFTNTKILFRRKPNGEPDKIIFVGEEESYLCINLNQKIK